jgi:hypothetical protein
MRNNRWLLRVAAIIVAAAVAGVYSVRRLPQYREHHGAASDFEWHQSGHGQPVTRILAKRFVKSADGAGFTLENFEFRLYQADGLHYDRITSARAIVSPADHRLYSPGSTEITLSVPSEGTPDNLMKIETDHFTATF